MNACDLQQALFRTLRERARRPRQLASEISGIIYKSKPTVYKKMQGNIALTMDELIAICSHYHLDIDPLLQKTPSFNSLLLDSGNEQSRADEALLTQIHQWSMSADSHLIVDVRGLFAHAFLNPEVAAFIMFTEQQRLDSDLQFSLIKAKYDPGATSLAARISHAYRSVRREEFWYESMFDRILTQIIQTLLRDAYERPTDALRLCDVLHKNLLQLHERYLSRLDKKAQLVTIHLADEQITTNHICLRNGDAYALYQGFWYRNWTLTHSPLIAKPAFLQLEASLGAARARTVNPDRFFTKVADKIKQTRRTIERQLYSVAQ